MESWENSTSTPQVKFEASPAESFVSTPGEMYPSLFSGDVSMDGAMTPQSPSAEGDDTPALDATPSTDKKAVKKRKSWGQVLPEPKTNLPPRKRAKTEDEKEQRRVERVLRNRRAAQFSRERKRQEVEALEKRNQELEALLQHHQTQNAMLLEELSKLRRSSGVLTRGSSPTLQPSPITLSQPLFGAGSEAKADMMDDFILMESNRTVDPSSLSPELTPVADIETEAPAPSNPAPSALATEAATLATASSDVTQHPAAVLCDLQCPSVEESPSWPTSQSRTLPALTLLLQLQFLLTASSAMLSACRNPLKLIAGALKHSLVLQATPSITSTIIWMVTLPPECRISTFPSSLTTASAALLQARPRAASRSPKISTPASAFSTLRIKSLQKLLTCSPSLARPLKDATLGLLRLVSEGRDDRVERLADGAPKIEGDQSRGPLLWPDGASLPSREVLLTLLWAIRVEERKILKAGEADTNPASQPASTIRPGSSVLHDNETNQLYVLPVAMKRKSEMDVTSSKRLRLGY